MKLGRIIALWGMIDWHRIVDTKYLNLMYMFPELDVYEILHLAL